MNITFDSTKIKKGLFYGGTALAFCMLQITLFPQYKIFGVIPDAMLSCVLAVAMFEGEKWGAVMGICAGFTIEALGATGLSLLPLVYMLCGYIAGICTEYIFRRTALTWTIYAGVGYLIHLLITLIYISVSWSHYSLGDAIRFVLLPEFFTSLALSYLIYFIFRLIAKRFHHAYELKN